MTSVPDIPEIARKSASRHVWIGTVLIGLMFGFTGVWAARTEISGAVFGAGVVVVETRVKDVQHPTGGVVTEILVQNGDRVAAGDLLIRLDETLTRANLHLITKQLDELAIREARLEAERDGSPSIVVPQRYLGREDDPEIAKRIAAETTFLRSRRAAMAAKAQQLEERIKQLDDEIIGLERQADAKSQEIDLLKAELTGVDKLETMQLVTTMRANELRREALRLDGERGQLEAGIAQTRGRIAETRLEVITLDQDFRSSVIQELRDNRAEQAGLSERRIAAEDQLKRTEIRAPQTGLVHDLAINNVGGVINPAERLMKIVPSGDNLIVEARVMPHDIDQLLNGDGTAYVRFSAFAQQTTPEVAGHLETVSPDLNIDPATGQTYYTARITIPKEEIVKLDQNRLVPGMPADVHFKTVDRTALSYLIKPMWDQMERAFRER
jgi:HlyD family secretion protein